MPRMATWVLAAAVSAASVVASAGGFGLSPLGASIPARESSAAISVENTGDAPIVIQVRALAWTQQDGKDTRTETRDLIVNPPIFKLAPGEQQLVRLASRTPPPRDAERAYRAVFTEVVPRDAPQLAAGFRVAVAMDVPVYVEALARAAPAKLAWTAARTAKGATVRVDNPGNVHVRVRDPEIAAGGTALVKRAFLDVLPGSWLDFDLPALPPGVSTVQLKTNDSDQAIVLEIPIAPAP